MLRRNFLKGSALIGTGVVVTAPGIIGASAQQVNQSGGKKKPTRIIMGGYGPSTTSFSQGLKFIGDRLESKFGKDVEPRYVYNVMAVGYKNGGDLRWLVDSGTMSLAYLTMATGIPELELAALPFLFSDTDEARAAMDGALGQGAIKRIEATSNYRVLGFFENGFRHISNNVRPVHTPSDMKDIKIRVLGMQNRTFKLLGADPQNMRLPLAIKALKAGTLEGQENPFENTVTYKPYLYQRYHTATFHSYLSRPIFVHRPTFDAWPKELQTEMRSAVRDAVTFQRKLHDQAEIDSAEIIRKAGGEIIDLTPEQRQVFVKAVAPIYADLNKKYSPDLLKLIKQ